MHKFPYREATSSLTGEPDFRPLLDVRLSYGPNAEWRTTALVDTGAPITVFDHGTGSALLVRFGNAGAETAMTKLLGQTLRVQFEYVDLCLLQGSGPSWTARVGFITDPTFVMPFQGLLGNDGFLDRWAVTFNKYYEYFILQEPDEAPG